jgi:hypothetical protein
MPPHALNRDVTEPHPPRCEGMHDDGCDRESIRFASRRVASARPGVRGTNERTNRRHACRTPKKKKEENFDNIPSPP